MVSVDYISALVRIALGEVGIREHGSNSGERVRLYQSSTWLEPSSWAWCAAFVCWCIREAAKVSEFDLILPRTPRAAEFVPWALKNGLAVIHSGRNLVRGDIVIYKFKTGYHIGIVSEDSSNGEFRAVEGNTNQAGSREGDGVFLKTRKVSSVFAVIAWRRCPIIKES